MDLAPETLAAEEDVGVPRVGDLREARFLLDVERDVLEVALDLYTMIESAAGPVERTGRRIG